MKSNSKKTIFWRVYLAFGFMALFAFAILGQIVHIQVAQGEKWRGMADSLTTRFVDVEPNRGNIYAADGSLLATSLSIYDLHMDLQTEFIKSLPKKALEDSLDLLATALAGRFNGKDEKTKWLWNHELNKAFEQKRRYHPIRMNVDHITLKEIKKFPLFRLGQFRGGLIVEQRSIRKRPYKLLAQRTIGYKRESIQPVGLEGAFDDYLNGVQGRRLLQKVSSRDWIPINDKNEIEPQNGKDIFTTIDVHVQDIAETALEKNLALQDAHHGCAVVMDVTNGKVVAIANLGKYKDDYYERYNYAIGESTQPGSTFKLAALMALLDGRYMTVDDTINTHDGVWNFYDQKMRDSKIGGHGTIDLRRIIEVSSNIGIAKSMNKHFGHQPKEFIDFLHEMRLHEKLDVPIAGEPKPFIKTPEDADWSGTTLPWMAHGYELELTPIQTLMIYNAVANKGTLMKPLFVTEVREINKTIQTFEPEVWAKNIISEDVANTCTEVLKGVIESDGGTATNIKTPGLSLAGKTGTAVVGKDKDKHKIYQASFAGFFPADNPKYSCIVVVNDPKKKYYGSDAAAPVFKEIAEKIYAYDIELNESEFAERVRNIKKRPTFISAKNEDLKTVYASLSIDFIENEEKQWAEPVLRGNKIHSVQKESKPGTLPSLIGLSLSDALYICENLGLRVQYDGVGNVYKQTPVEGSPLVKNSKVYINLN